MCSCRWKLQVYHLTDASYNALTYLSHRSGQVQRLDLSGTRRQKSLCSMSLAHGFQAGFCLVGWFPDMEALLLGPSSQVADSMSLASAGGPSTNCNIIPRSTYALLPSLNPWLSSFPKWFLSSFITVGQFTVLLFSSLKQLVFVFSLIFPVIEQEIKLC